MGRVMFDDGYAEKSFFRGMEPEEVVSKRDAEVYVWFVRSEVERWSDQFPARRQLFELIGSQVLEAHRELCLAPESQVARNRWRVADDQYWSMDEELLLSEDDEELEESDPRDRGWHEGWVWEFRHADESEYGELLETRREEYEEARRLLATDPENPVLAMGVDLYERAWKETAYLISLSLEDPKALAALFQPGDSSVDDREWVHPESVQQGRCENCGRTCEIFTLISMEDGSPRDACVECEPEFAKEASQYRTD